MSTVLKDIPLKSLSLQEATLPQDITTSSDEKRRTGAHKCAKCQAAARMYCQSCSYDEEKDCEAHRWYCGKDCQKDDWPQHRDYCRSIVNVNHLYRTVKAIKKVFYAFRENFFDLQIKSITVMKEDKIVMTESQYDHRIFVPFPDHLIKDPLDKEAVLSYLCCDDAVGRMQGLFERLLAGTYKGIKEIVVDLKNNAREVLIPGKLSRAFPQDTGESQEEKCYHKVLKITMNSNTAYAIDLAGAQFGYHDPVSPWTAFMSTRVSFVSKILTFGESKRVLSCLPEDILWGIREQPARYALWGNQKMIVEEIESTFDSWAAAVKTKNKKNKKKDFNPVVVANLSKKNHDILMADMVGTLASALEAYVVTAPKSKGYIVAIREFLPYSGYPNGRKVYFYGDGSTKDVEEVRKEAAAPGFLMFSGHDRWEKAQALLDQYRRSLAEE